MSFVNAEPPYTDPMVDQAKHMTQKWVDWLSDFTLRFNSAQTKLTTVTKVQQVAAIGVTPIPTGALSNGLYRVEWYARITTAATVASSLTVTLAWTESSVALTQSGAAITGNTTATVQSGSVLLRVDAATPISYSTSYGTAGATAMQYRLDLALTRVSA